MYKQIEFITLNIASFGVMMASIEDYVPVFVGVIVGLSIAGLNIARIITEVKKWRVKKQGLNKSDNSE